jgi:hypothetical protein
MGPAEVPLLVFDVEDVPSGGGGSAAAVAGRGPALGPRGVLRLAGSGELAAAGAEGGNAEQHQGLSDAALLASTRGRTEAAGYAKSTNGTALGAACGLALRLRLGQRSSSCADVELAPGCNPVWATCLCPDRAPAQREGRPRPLGRCGCGSQPPPAAWASIPGPPSPGTASVTAGAEAPAPPQDLQPQPTRPQLPASSQPPLLAAAASALRPQPIRPGGATARPPAPAQRPAAHPPARRAVAPATCAASCPARRRAAEWPTWTAHPRPAARVAVAPARHPYRPRSGVACKHLLRARHPATAELLLLQHHQAPAPLRQP